MTFQNSLNKKVKTLSIGDMIIFFGLSLFYNPVSCKIDKGRLSRASVKSPDQATGTQNSIVYPAAFLS